MGGRGPTALGGPSGVFSVARFNADGSLDTATFNAPNGYASVDIGGAQDIPFGIALHPTGRSWRPATTTP